MIQGNFGSKGELYFEIELIAADGSVVAVDALLDTGFTEWLAMDTQDIVSLGWLYVDRQEMQTARGDVIFNRYQGTVSFDGQELTIPVLAGEEISEILIGLPWLETRRLVVDRKAGLLRLGEE
jgi:predicted aspartyl protease